MVTRREKKKGWTYNQYKTTTSIFIHDTIDEDNKANIQLKIYTLQKRKPLVQHTPVSFDI
jgi:hypothetical protein